MRGSAHRIYLILISGLLLGLVSLVMNDAATTAAAPLRPAAPAASLRALTAAGKNLDGFGSWSPDGKQLLFMRDGQIWLAGQGGEAPRQIAGSETEWDAAPAWRPDGREIAYIRHELSGESATVMLLDPAVGKSRELVQENQPIGAVAFAPDGKRLYYTTPQRLMFYDLAARKGDGLLGVTSDWEMLAGGVAVSPDNQTVVFGAGPRNEQGVAYDLWTIQLKEPGKAKRLTKDGGIMPSFDPQGKRLVYRNPRGKTGIYLMELGKGAGRLIVPDEGRTLYFHPMFAPDGRSLVISRLMLDGNPQGEGAGRFTSSLWQHRLAGSGGD